MDILLEESDILSQTVSIDRPDHSLSTADSITTEAESVLNVNLPPLDLITNTPHIQHRDNILEQDGNTTVVDFLINQLLNLTPFCIEDADTIPGAKSFSDLYFTTQKIIGKYNILSATKLLDPTTVDIPESDLQLLYEGYTSCSRPISPKSNNSGSQSSSASKSSTSESSTSQSSTSESSTSKPSTSKSTPRPQIPEQPQPSKYSISSLESLNEDMGIASLRTLDIDSFLVIPTYLAVAKRGLNVIYLLPL